MPQWLWDLDEDKLKTLYLDNKYSTKKLGGIFGISSSTVRNHLIQAGIKTRNKSESLAIPLDIDKIKKLYCEDKISVPKIAILSNVNSNTIRKRLNQIGIKTRQFKGIHCSPATEFKRGNHYSPDTEWRKGGQTAGENHHSWKGGITPISAKIRNGQEHRDWANSVYERDNYICQRCGIHCNEKNIIAHHIKPFADYLDLRFEINNGITLCRSCHLKEHNAN